MIQSVVVFILIYSNIYSILHKNNVLRLEEQGVTLNDDLIKKKKKKKISHTLISQPLQLPKL